MKKVICLILLCMVCLFFVSCDDASNIVLNNMSDLRVNYFEGQNDSLYANLSCGYREETFAYDGVSTKSLECGVITLGYFAECSYKSVQVVLIVDGEECEYVLERSPYENVFMEDIGKIIKNDSNVCIKLKNSDEVIELKEVSKDFKVSYKDAVKIGAKHFKSELENLYFNGTLHAECYLKLVSKAGFDKKYWYFSIIDQQNENYSILIDVTSGEITESDIK